MFRRLLITFFLGPALTADPKKYFAVTILQQTLLLLAACVWLVAPVAIGLAFGAWWAAPWLIPTSALIFFAARAKNAGTGG